MKIEENNNFNYTDFSTIDNYWSYYVGEFNSDYFEGFGTMYFKNNEKYVGGFDKGMMNGQGIYYWGDQEIKGVWKENILKNT